jgi:hypothetical protein
MHKVEAAVAELKKWQETLHGRDLAIAGNVITRRDQKPQPQPPLPVQYFPFQIVDNRDGTVSVIYGTLNDTVPALAGVASGSQPAQALGSLAAGTYTIYLVGNLSDDGRFFVEDSYISTTMPGDPESTCYTTIGMVAVSGASVTILQNLRHSQWFLRCPDRGDQFGAR